MSILDELQEASYRGAVFFLTLSSITGGRKDAKKEIVNSDAQVIEDLGLRQPAFSLTGIVAEREGETYKQARDNLLDALQAGGRAPLIHPFYGTIEDVVCRSFTISEDMTAVGIATVTMNFEISNTLGTPEVLVAVLGTVATAAEQATTALESEVAGEYNVTDTFEGNLLDAIEKGAEFVETVRDVSDKLVQVAALVDQFSKFVSDMAADLTKLIAAPAALAESIRGAVSSLNGLLQTPTAVFDAMKGLFDFGDLDVRFSTDTAGKQERQKNRDLFNSQVQGQALADAYVAVAQLDLPTVEDIDDTSAVLEEQFQKISNAGAIDRDSFDSLVAARIAIQEFFGAQRATKPRRVTVRTNTTPARVLSYTLYGTSNQGTTVARLNDVRDASFIEGEIQVLSS